MSAKKCVSETDKTLQLYVSWLHPPRHNISCYNYPCAVCARVMRLCPSVYVCHQKHACLRLTARKSPRKHSLQLLIHWIDSLMKTFSVLASLVRVANPWLSKATCPCKSAYGIVGVSPNLLSMLMSSLSLTCNVHQSHCVTCVLQ